MLLYYRFSILIIMFIFLISLFSCFSPQKSVSDQSTLSTLSKRSDQSDRTNQSNQFSQFNQLSSPNQSERSNLQSTTISAVDLYHHDPSPTFGELKKPTIWLHADKFQIIDENNWKVESIKAVIYDTKTGSERIRVFADSGTFVKMKTASLSGKVHAEMDEIEFDTEYLLWTNKTETEPAKITTDRKVSLVGKNISLTCSSLIIYPEEKNFELTEVSGIVPLVLRTT